MTIAQYINTAVDNEFKGEYWREAAKCYLYKDLRNLTNQQVAYARSCSPTSVAAKISFVTLVLSKKEVNKNFHERFMKIQKACEKYATDRVNQRYSNRVVAKIGLVRKELLQRLESLN